MIKDKKQNVVRDASSSCSEESIKPRFSILAEFKHSQLLLRHFISRYMISSHDIEDVSQETFLRAFKAEQQKKIDFPKAFLFRIAKNIIMSEFSRKTRKITDYIEDYENSEVLPDTDSLEDNIMAQQKLGIYCEAVAALPSQCRRAVVMKKVYGMQNSEIAKRMELSISTVEKHLSKGIKQCNSVISIRYQDKQMSTRVTGEQPSAKVINTTVVK
ncbi:MAG: RNA polymerase sigma factor (sigma-70 family) [Paraglaciecola sp.]|jgi:RNA polymerase sigma factor (sigma-70 family)